MSNDKKTPAPPPKAPEQPPKEPPKWLVKIKKIITTVVGIIKAIIHSKIVTSTSKAIGSLGWWGWLKIFTCFSLLFLTYGVYKTAPHWKKYWELPYLRTFENVANDKFTYADEEEVVRYANDLLAAQNIILLNKIVVNIRAGRLSTKNPMIAFDLYIRTDSEEASVEIKQREKQLQDVLQRVCEDLNYDQLLTEEGKHVWKQKMKRELNLVINTGRVRDLFFKTLLIKP